jgi:hypothetical protein
VQHDLMVAIIQIGANIDHFHEIVENWQEWSE